MYIHIPYVLNTCIHSYRLMYRLCANTDIPYVLNTDIHSYRLLPMQRNNHKYKSPLRQ